MVKRKYNKPKFCFKVSTTDEMKAKMGDYEKNTGQQVPDDFYKITMEKEKKIQYSEYLKITKKEKAEHKEMVKKVMKEAEV